MAKLFPVIAEHADPEVSTCTRRAMLQALGAAAATTAAFGTLGACGQQGSDLPTATATSCGSNMHCIALSDMTNAPLNNVGGAMLLDTATDTIMVIRQTSTQVIAISAICTHKQCSMNFDTTKSQLTCPCHGSVFGEDGSVVNGPARQPLAVYSATLANGTITVTA